MKKNKWIGLGLVLTMIGGATACGAINKANEVQRADIDIETTHINDNINDDKSLVIEEDTRTVMKLYEDFLNNEEPVYFDKVIENSNERDYLCFSGFAKEDVKGKPYTFSEMLKLTCESETSAYWTIMEPKSISYAYIDCGMDGKKELVITFNNMGENLDYTDIFVISAIQDKLQVVFSDSFGYRSYGEINEYGHYVNGGSSGAATSGSTYFYISENGDVYLDYSYELVSAVWGLFIPDNTDYERVADEFGIDMIEIEKYSLDNTNPGEDYMDYLMRSKWIYHAVDDNYNELEGKEYYEEGNPYKTFWNSTGLPLFTENEIEAEIEKHRNDIGMNPEIVNGEPAKYTTLSDEEYNKLFEWKDENFKYTEIDTEISVD